MSGENYREAGLGQNMDLGHGRLLLLFEEAVRVQAS